MPLIITETRIKARRELCFDLSRSIDLHQISTSKSKEYVIGGRKKGLIELDETVTWRAKHFGIWQNLTAKITEFDRPNFFTDEMVKGTFKSFKHEHIFENDSGNTLMIDKFDFESPFGIFGEVFNRMILTKYMKRFLEERNMVIKEYAESEKWKDVINK